MPPFGLQKLNGKTLILNNMLAANFDITIDRAADYLFILTINNVAGPVNIGDITGPPAIDAADFYGDVRNATTKIQAAEFDWELTTNGSDGQVSFSLPAATTKLLYSPNKYEYDIFMMRNGLTVRLLEGKVTVRNNRTNDV